MNYADAYEEYWLRSSGGEPVHGSLKFPSKNHYWNLPPMNDDDAEAFSCCAPWFDPRAACCLLFVALYSDDDGRLPGPLSFTVAHTTTCSYRNQCLLASHQLRGSSSRSVNRARRSQASDIGFYQAL